MTDEELIAELEELAVEQDAVAAMVEGAGAEMRAALLRSAASRIEGLAWRTMESAPLGSAIVYEPTWGVSEAHLYDSGRWIIASTNGRIMTCFPTHWMPLPAPPALGEGE